MLQQATPSRSAVEDYLAMGLVRVTFRVEPGDESLVGAQLGQLADLIEPYTAS